MHPACNLYLDGLGSGEDIERGKVVSLDIPPESFVARFVFGALNRGSGDINTFDHVSGAKLVSGTAIRLVAVRVNSNCVKLGFDVADYAAESIF